MTIEKLKDKLHDKIEIHVCEVEENTLIAQGMLKALGMMDEVLETAEQEQTDKSNLEKICEELAAENDDLRDQLAMRDRFKQEPCEDAISRKDAEQMFRNIRCHLKPQDYKSAEEFNTRDLMLLNAEQMIHALPSIMHKSGKWIPVSERLPELNRPLLVTSYHRVYYGYLISESGNYGYPVFRIHGLGDKNRDWVQETMSYEPYSLGRIDAWMYLDIPEPYKAESEE